MSNNNVVTFAPRNPEGFVTGGNSTGIGFNFEWQDGPFQGPDGTEQTGAVVTDVLKAVCQRLEAYKNSPSSCRENSLAITHIEEAMHWLDARLRNREQRGVLGTYAE